MSPLHQPIRLVRRHPAGDRVREAGLLHPDGELAADLECVRADDLVLHGSRAVDLVVSVRIGNQGEDIGARRGHYGAAHHPPVVGVDHGDVAHEGILCSEFVRH